MDSALLEPAPLSPGLAEAIQARTALAALDESERRSRAILNGTNGYLILLTAEGLILDLNRTALEAMTEDRASTIGGEFAEVGWFADRPDQAARVRAGVTAAAAGALYSAEIAINGWRGETRLVDFIFNPILGDGARNGFVVVDGRDVTERRAMEEHNKKLEMQLMESRKMESLGTLAGGVAHEINTPIQYIGDNIRFLTEAFETMAAALDTVRAADGLLLPAEMKDTIDYMLKEVPAALLQTGQGVTHVRQIVQSIRQFSHPGKGEMVPEDLEAAVRVTAAVSRSQWRYVATMEFDIDPVLPPVPCRIGKINQVLLNLIVNAAQAIEETKREGFGTIKISLVNCDPWVEIRVADNGAGIAPEHRSRVFDPFFTTKPPGRGTGQGLSICHSIIVREHGGEISFESVPGKGTTFIVRLPLSPSPQPGD